VNQSQTVPQRDQSLLPPAMMSVKRSHQTILWEVALVGGVLLLALLLRLWHLSALTDNYDEGVYWASLRSLYNGDGLFSSVFSSQPPFFLLSLYPLVALLGPTQVAARLGVVCFSLLGVLAIYFLARRLGGRLAGFAAALLLACDYLYLLQSQTIDAEAPSVALIIVAMAAASYADDYPWQAAFISGVATSLANLEKLFAVAAIPPILCLFLGQLIAFERAQPVPPQQAALASSRFSCRRLPHRQTIKRAGLLGGAYLLGLSLATLAVFLPYLGQLSAVYQQAIAFHLAASRSFPSTLSQNLSILLGTHPVYPLALVGLLGFITGLIRRRWQVLTAAILVLAALVILLRQAPLFPHHLVLLIPGLVLAAAIGLAPMPGTLKEGGIASYKYLPGILPGWDAWGSKALLAGVPVLLLLGVVLLNLRYATDYPLGMPAADEARLLQVASDVQRLTTPQQQVITDDQYVAMLANRSVPPALVDTSAVRIATGYLTTAQMIAIAEQPQVSAILFYSGRFGNLPGFRSWVEGHFHLVRDYGNRQDLYLRSSP
jgi:hypothetical protein